MNHMRAHLFTLLCVSAIVVGLATAAWT